MTVPPNTVPLLSNIKADFHSFFCSINLAIFSLPCSSEFSPREAAGSTPLNDGEEEDGSALWELMMLCAYERDPSYSARASAAAGFNNDTVADEQVGLVHTYESSKTLRKMNKCMHKVTAIVFSHFIPFSLFRLQGEKLNNTIDPN